MLATNGPDGQDSETWPDVDAERHARRHIVTLLVDLSHDGRVGGKSEPGHGPNRNVQNTSRGAQSGAGEATAFRGHIWPRMPRRA